MGIYLQIWNDINTQHLQNPKIFQDKKDSIFTSENLKENLNALRTVEMYSKDTLTFLQISKSIHVFHYLCCNIKMKLLNTDNIIIDFFLL